jgi:hypothetical protein
MTFHPAFTVEAYDGLRRTIVPDVVLYVESVPHDDPNHPGQHRWLKIVFANDQYDDLECIVTNREGRRIELIFLSVNRPDGETPLSSRRLGDDEPRLQPEPEGRTRSISLPDEVAGDAGEFRLSPSPEHADLEDDLVYQPESAPQRPPDDRRFDH